MVPASGAVGNAGGDIAINSVTFIDVTGQSCTITAATGDKLLILWTIHIDSASGAMQTTFNVEAADVLSTSALQTVSANNDSKPVTSQYLHTVVSGGTITVKARARHLSAAQSIRNDTNGVPILTVLNLKQ